MSRDDTRSRPRDRGYPQPSQPRSRSASYNIYHRPRSQRSSYTMDHDAPMTGVQTVVGYRDDIVLADARSDSTRHERVFVDFKDKMAQDVAGIQEKMDKLLQQVEAVPARVAERMSKASTPASRDWNILGFQISASQQNQEQARIAKLQDEKKVLAGRNAALQQKFDNAQRELDTARRRVADVEGQLRDNQEEVNKLRGNEARLRSIILDQAGVQKMSDDEISQSFLKLRRDIQTLSYNTFYAVDASPCLPDFQQDEPGTRSLTAFYSPATWGNLRVPDRRHRMRAMIYEKLHFHILNSNCFGLQRPRSSKPDEGEIETGLRRFEDMLKEREVNDGVVSDWRISTINCVERAGIEDATSAIATEDIFCFFSPLLSKHARVSDEDTLRAKILELCKTAFKLRMQMRKSKDRYLVHTIVAGTSLQLAEDVAGPEAIEGGKPGEESDEIVYTIFGALTKQPHGAGQPVKVLEKAQVVLRRM